MGDFFSGASEGIDTMAAIALKRREHQWELDKQDRKFKHEIEQETQKAQKDLIKGVLDDSNTGMSDALKNDDKEGFRMHAERKAAAYKALGYDNYEQPMEEVAGPGLPGSMAGPPEPVSQIKVPMTALEREEAKARITQEAKAGQPQTQLGKLHAERALIAEANPNDPRLKQYDAGIAKATMSPNFKVSYDEAGNPVIEYGVGVGAGGMQKGTAKKIEEKIMTIDDSLQSVDDIISTFDKDFLTYQGKLKDFGLNILDKARVDLSPEDAEFLEKFGEFHQDAWEQVNTTIKAMTGAQMSEKEAKRLRKQMPDPEKDGPTKYVSKLKNLQRKLRAKRTRYYVYRDQGLSEGQVTKLMKNKGYEGLTDQAVQTHINDKGKELANTYQSIFTNKTAKEIDTLVVTSLKEMFKL